MGLVGLGPACHGRLHGRVDHVHLARLAVELEVDGAGAVVEQLADGQQGDDEGLALLDLDQRLLA